MSPRRPRSARIAAVASPDAGATSATGASGSAASPGDSTASIERHAVAGSNASGAAPGGRKKNDGPPSFSIRHQGQQPFACACAWRGSSRQVTSRASSVSSAAVHSAAVGRGLPAIASRPKACSKSSATGGVTSLSQSEKGGGSNPARIASRPKAKSPCFSAVSTGIARAGCRPAKG